MDEHRRESMNFWLMKSEPDEFSIDDLVKAPKQTTAWFGVRNYTARNFMRDDMRVGDGVLFYHSSCPEPGIAGLATVASRPYPDPSQFDRKSPYFDPNEQRKSRLDAGRREARRKTASCRSPRCARARRSPVTDPAARQPALDHARVRGRVKFILKRWMAEARAYGGRRGDGILAGLLGSRRHDHRLLARLMSPRRAFPPAS